MKRILFVDDESKILDGVRRMLHGDRQRWEMHFAVGGEAALQACETTSFDVVISDMLMPNMDGASLLEHIRDRFPNTARIVLSGFADGALAARAASVAHRFLAKPCQAAEIQLAIERVCALQEVLNTPEIRAVVGSIGQLPSLSTTFLHLRQTVDDPKATIGAVAGIIEQDIAMSAKVLQLTNSAFFGVAQQVTSLQSAVAYLGMKTIKNLALASEAFRIFVPNARVPHSVFDSIQEHALRTAAIAGALPLPPKTREVAVIAGLLHDIGRLFLASAMPEEFCASLSLASAQGCKAFEAEEELLGTSHAEIGAYLLGLWGIPNLAVEAIAHHHRPTRIQHAGFDCPAVIYVADLLANLPGPGLKGAAAPEIEECDRARLETLGVLPQFGEFRKLALQIHK